MRRAETLTPGMVVRREGSDDQWREIELAVRATPRSRSATRTTTTVIALRFTDGTGTQSPLTELWEVQP